MEITSDRSEVPGSFLFREGYCILSIFFQRQHSVRARNLVVK